MTVVNNSNNYILNYIQFVSENISSKTMYTMMMKHTNNVHNFYLLE